MENTGRYCIEISMLVTILSNGSFCKDANSQHVLDERFADRQKGRWFGVCVEVLLISEG